MPSGRHDYTVSHERVRMRDGVQLLTDVYVPVGTSSGAILIRTPYGRDGLIAQLTAGFFASHGYHVVNQSCRGTFGSGGDFDPFSQEIADGADAVAWLRQQPWFGGRFALWGASYAGHTAWAVMLDPPPELATAVVAISAHDAHWVVHGAGAFSLEEVANLMDGLGHLDVGAARGILRGVTASRRLRPAFEDLPLTRAQDTVLSDSGMPYRDWLQATDPEDPVWRNMRLGPALARVTVPVLLQTGWQDRFPAQMLEQYERLQRRGVAVGLTIGPWTHVQTATKGAGTVMTEALDWLAEHLSATSDRQRPRPVRIFVTGAKEWRHLATWPPPTEERVLYPQPDGGLSETVPPPRNSPTAFTYDPADPTPAVGGRVINPTIGGHRDNRKLEERSDVLIFTSTPLVEPMEVIGSPRVELVYETDNPHADFFVRLCEVRQDGRSINVSDGFTRLKPDQPNGPIQLRLDAIAHRFKPGVRIRLQVSGGAHPRYARNLGTSEDPSTGTHLAPSQRVIFHGDGGFSRVDLPCQPVRLWTATPR
ncbi:CocE/NonD family hydrolase [Nocardioides sp.]|uniref:CocE/NonD family hydrolase n=1 Tax=Nocardioides sp. TaxID=35761 RepID=UPI002601C0B0|nr:CocE/NonD family hydrolase [Nocardioides sp.]